MTETGDGAPRLSMAGAGGLLLDAAGPTFRDDIQARIWAVGAAMARVPGVTDSVPGMNNLMIVFDPLDVAPDMIEARLMEAWRDIVPEASESRLIDVPVTYGGPGGEDLDDHARHLGLSRDEVIRRHTAPTYSVAAVGAMPGFIYLSGLDPLLARPRRANPRMAAPVGSVMIGGAQTGIMPCTAPSGWHILGHTTLPLFDAHATPPATFRPGDRLRFTVAGVLP